MTRLIYASDLHGNRQLYKILLDKSVEEVHKASLSGLKKLEMTIKQDEATLHSAHITAEDKEKQKISISIDALTEKASKIQVRFGVFGDQEKSQMVLNAILKKL